MMAAAGGDNYWYVRTSSSSPNDGNIVPGGLDVDSSGVVYAVATVFNDTRRTMILKKVQDGAPPSINERITIHTHNPYGTSYGDAFYTYKNCQLYDNESKLHIDGHNSNPYGYVGFNIYRYTTSLTQINLYNDGSYNNCGHEMEYNGSSGSGYGNRCYPPVNANYYTGRNGSVRENGDFWLQGSDGYYATIAAFITQSSYGYLTNLRADNTKQAGNAYSTNNSFRTDAAGSSMAVDNDNDYVYWCGVVSSSGSPYYYSTYPFFMAARWNPTNQIMDYHPQMSYPVSPNQAGFSGGNRYSGTATAVSPVADSNGDKWACAVWNANYSYYREFYYQRIKLTSTGKTVQWGSHELSISTSDDKWLYDAKFDSQENLYVLFNYRNGSGGAGGLVLLKFNSSGTYQWSRTFKGLNGYQFCDAAAESSTNRMPFNSSMVIDANDNIYIHTGSKNPTAGWNPFLIKYPSDGSLTGSFGDMEIRTDGPSATSNIGWANSTGEYLYTPAIQNFIHNNPDSGYVAQKNWGIRSGLYNTNSRTTSNSSQLIT